MSKITSQCADACSGGQTQSILFVIGFMAMTPSIGLACGHTYVCTGWAECTVSVLMEALTSTTAKVILGISVLIAPILVSVTKTIWWKATLFSMVVLILFFFQSIAFSLC